MEILSKSYLRAANKVKALSIKGSNLTFPLICRYAMYGLIFYKVCCIYDKLKVIIALKKTQIQLFMDRGLKIDPSKVSDELLHDIISKKMMEEEVVEIDPLRPVKEEMPIMKFT